MAPSFLQFLRLGVEHMITGYDHVLFLFALLIVGNSVRSAAKLITSFTVAHSITLALATFNVVHLPPHVVEPLIAISIIYVGLENLWHRHLQHRWLLTFGFGLIHGLGFASVLRDTGIGGAEPLYHYWPSTVASNSAKWPWRCWCYRWCGKPNNCLVSCRILPPCLCPGDPG